MTGTASTPQLATHRLRTFVRDFAGLITRTADEDEILAEGTGLLATLVAVDDWLPEDCTGPSAERHQQYLLHCDSAERFSVVSFVWAPGQAAPIHDHTIWGMVGVLRGAERTQGFTPAPSGKLIPQPAQLLRRGEVETFSPARGDIHRVGNALDDAPSISIHVYGANIGAVRRSVFTLDGERKSFISSYSNASVPNIWSGPIG